MLFFKCSCYLTDITEVGVLRIPPPPTARVSVNNKVGGQHIFFYSRLKTHPNRRHSWFSASGLYKELGSRAQREQGLVGGSNCFIWFQKWSILYMLIQKYACILSRTLLATSQIFYYIEVDIINILSSHLIIYLKIYLFMWCKCYSNYNTFYK